MSLSDTSMLLGPDTRARRSFSHAARD